MVEIAYAMGGNLLCVAMFDDIKHMRSTGTIDLRKKRINMDINMKY